MVKQFSEMSDGKLIIKNLNETLLKGAEAMDRIGVPYIITGGTLLGIYRDKTLMAHDRDVDVDVLVEDIGEYEEFRKKLSKETGKDVVLHNNYFTNNYQYKEQTVPFDVFIIFKKGKHRFRHFYGENNQDAQLASCLIWPEDSYDTSKWTTI